MCFFERVLFLTYSFKHIRKYIEFLVGVLFIRDCKVWWLKVVVLVGIKVGNWNSNEPKISLIRFLVT